MEFNVGTLIQNAFQRGIKYFVPVFLNSIFWILTIWIPYLNVGTTIGLMVGVVAKMSRDEEVSITEIFDAKYRKNMGEFFLVIGLVNAGVMVGFMFMFVPATVIALAWMLAPLFVVDKDMNPIEAIKKSNDVTYGKKWLIFFAYVAVWILITIAFFVIYKIAGVLAGIPVIGGLLKLILLIAASGSATCIYMATTASIYGELSKK